MLNFYQNFIGYQPDRRNEIFSNTGMDGIESYLKNLKTMPPDWYYRKNHFRYQRNSLGHRCKDLTKIDLNNYILTIGCSLTEGIGLKLEDTYTAKLAELMGCDYYNLGLSSTGLDVLQHNLYVWFSSIKEKPKLLVIQVPEISRFTSVYHEFVDDLSDLPAASLELVSTVASDENFDHESLRFLAMGDLNKHWLSRYRMYRFQWKSLNVPIIECHMQPLKHIKRNQVMFNCMDKARDLGHPGIKTNQQLADDIFARYKELYTV